MLLPSAPAQKLHRPLYCILYIALIALFVTVVTAATCNNEFYCNGQPGSILSIIQPLELYPDQKSFVDRVIITETDEEFRRLWNEVHNSHHKNTTFVTEFLDKYTLPPGNDLITIEPTDFNPTPTFLKNIPKEMEKFAQDLNTRWKTLLRGVKPNLPYATTSLLQVPNPFIVAGGRFREWYNWDSYWILKGLMVSEMNTTAKGMIDNFLWCIEQFGYVPNGGRMYYINRSQPPFTAAMVWEYYTKYYQNNKNDDGQTWLENAFKLLQKEYDYWMSSQHSVLIMDKHGREHILNRYNVDTTTPRPESYYYDLKIVQEKFKDRTQLEKNKFYKDIASGAESGWDFSSRWFNVANDMTTIHTTDVIPVDLNAILYKYEESLALIARELQDNTTTYVNEYNKYILAMKARSLAFVNILWNNSLQQWFDYDITTYHQIINDYNKVPVRFISQWVPIWSGVSHLDHDQANTLLSKFINQNIKVGGVPTSNQFNGEQQWDGNNVWAPLQWLLSEGLHKTSTTYPTPKNDPALFKIINTFITTTYCGWSKTDQHLMYEKYHAEHVGKPGGDGEYVVQDGFGWTNGLVLYYLEKYGKHITIGKC